MNNLKYLGYVIDFTGIHVNPDKVQILKDWSIPQNIYELRSFLGLENFYRQFYTWIQSHRMAFESVD